tara:strand:- start:9 stop:206 length:198 start_codon:yes stop_codon:yes gene_type:complete
MPTNNFFQKIFDTLESARSEAQKVADTLESNVSIHENKNGFSLWEGGKFVEWVKPQFDESDCHGI